MLLKAEHRTDRSEPTDRSDKLSIPVQFEIDGARSEPTVEMTGPQFELKDHRIPLERTARTRLGQGLDSGRREPGRQRVLLRLRPTGAAADDHRGRRPAGRSAAATGRRRSRPIRRCNVAAEVVTAEQLATVEWEQVSLLLWQAPLPTDDAAEAGPSVRRPRRPGRLLPAARARQRRPLPGCAGSLGLSPPDGRRGRDLARRSGPAGPHAKRRGAAGRPVGDPPLLRADRRVHAAGDAERRRTAARARAHESRRRLLLRDDADARRFVAGDQRRRAVRARAAALAAGAAGAGQHAAARRRRCLGDEHPPTWQQVAGPADALSTDFAFHGGVYASGEQAAGRQPRGGRGSGAGSGRRARRRAVPRARLRPRRRPGRQPRRR